ncbi:hypothetical protein SALBM135S_08620 [Streptomyces alboniger]
MFHRWGDRHMLGGPADNGLYIVGVSPQRHERESFRADLEGSVHAHALRCAPIAKALAGATRVGRIYGVRRFFGYFREAAGAGWVLLGDAGHFKDPAGGRGIGDAFHQADSPAIGAALGESGTAGLGHTAGFGRWRDRTYAEYYGLASDLGVAGLIAGVVRVVRGLHADGKVDGVLNLLSHRASVLEVLTPGRVLGATGRAVLRGRARRRSALRELRRLTATEIRRRRAMRRPVYQSGPQPRPVQQDHPPERIGEERRSHLPGLRPRRSSPPPPTPPRASTARTRPRSPACAPTPPCFPPTVDLVEDDRDVFTHDVRAGTMDDGPCSNAGSYGMRDRTSSATRTAGAKAGSPT